MDYGLARRSITGLQAAAQWGLGPDLVQPAADRLVAESGYEEMASVEFCVGDRAIRPWACAQESAPAIARRAGGLSWAFCWCSMV